MELGMVLLALYRISTSKQIKFYSEWFSMDLEPSICPEFLLLFYKIIKYWGHNFIISRNVITEILLSHNKINTFL